MMHKASGDVLGISNYNLQMEYFINEAMQTIENKYKIG